MFEYTVKTNVGDEFHFQSDGEKTIAEIKEEIEDKCGIPSVDCTIYYGGDPCSDF